MPTKRRIVETLKKQDLLALVDYFDLEVIDRRVLDHLVDAIASSKRARLPELLGQLNRETLKESCRQLGLDDSGREKDVLVSRLLGQEEERESKTPPKPSKPEQLIHPSISTNPPAQSANGSVPSVVASGPPSTTTPTTPTAQSILQALPLPRLLDLCRVFGFGVRGPKEAKTEIIQRLVEQLNQRLPALLTELGREELRAQCRVHGLSDEGRARIELQQRLLVAAGLDPATMASLPPPQHADGLPEEGQIVQARHRQWLVEKVEPGELGQSALVKMVCLDDDDPGRPLEVLWDLELGARVIDPQTQGLGSVNKLDPPSHFGAYLHALKWSAVSAADASRFQAPFRSGIKIMAHQLIPLMKALQLPRANLFIADDTGLGKTIEAGLVLQELLLRQQADFVLVICPASVSLQWRDEMQRRFGLHFEVMTRTFISYRRQERGFGVNPWATHNRFIISHPLIRRPEYRDPLLAHLGPRAKKGLLILDEAHTAAPASASKYAVDSDITRTVRDLAPRFDNRLFLSATPHNGHSNSFSALLELLDPARFTRGVPVKGREALEPIMVRRLKRDLRQLGVERFPRRLLVQFGLRHQQGKWFAEQTIYDAESAKLTAGATIEVHEGPPTELELAEKLAQYTALCAPEKGRGRFVFIHLQQRLLSSPEAFARTLEVHAKSVERRGGPIIEKPDKQLKLEIESDPETHGVDEETLAVESDEAVRASTADLPTLTEQATSLLREMGAMAENARRVPDTKVKLLFAWMREQLCPAIGLGPETKASRAWTNRRVILFTEYADTKRYLVELLEQAIEHTDLADQRIRTFHGGMGDESREEVQRAFNAPPDREPLRILVATDAAREGVNLQGHCADLFHIDIPWNPSRLEQRNGRIDRTLQTADEVRCHYFIYPDRAEDRVLKTLVRKVETVQRELGSLGAVLLDHIETILEPGIDQTTHDKIEKVGDDAHTATVEEELETQRKDLKALEAEVHQAGSRLERSKRALQVDPDCLRGVVNIGLQMAGYQPLSEGPPTQDARPSFILPTLDSSWDRTLDTLRPPRQRTESFWDWRQKPPRPVTFHPLTRLTDDAEQLHLAHPFVTRILDRFLAQGFGAHDLTRVAAVVAPDESVVRVVAYARLSLFGPGAARLHDEIVSLAAAWPQDATKAQPYKDRATAVEAIRQVEQLLATNTKAPGKVIQSRIAQQSTAVYSALWPELQADADARAVEAKNGLLQRGRREADELKALLERQKQAINKARTTLSQTTLFEVGDKHQRRQVELDLKHLEDRSQSIDQEIESEPPSIEALYAVRMIRLSPVGLVVSWPEALT